MNQSRTISVVIPCYNAEAFIEETIDSALAQTHPPTEILVVDDGSTDRSRDIVRAIGGVVRLIEQPNQGESVARNAGWGAATGDWIAFLDADDLWRPEKTEVQLQQLQDGDIASVSNMQVFYSDGRQDAPLSGSFASEQWNDLRYLAQRNSFLPSALIVQKSVKTRFPTWTKFGEDLLFSLDLARAGHVRMVDQPLMRRRVHDANQSAQRDMAAHQALAFLEWLDRRQDELPKEWLPLLKAVHAKAVIVRCELARYQRHWDAYDSIREALESFRDCPEVVTYLGKRTLPRVVYSIADRVRNWA